MKEEKNKNTKVKQELMSDCEDSSDNDDHCNSTPTKIYKIVKKEDGSDGWSDKYLVKFQVLNLIMVF